MHGEYNNTETEEQSVLGGIDLGVFKYDVRVFLISLRKRLPFLLLIPLIITAITVGYVYSMPKNWKATCVLFKSTEDLAKEDELSTLRRTLDIDVIKDMIRTKRNMRTVLKNLELPMSLQSLYGATTISVDEDNGNNNMVDINASSVSARQAADIANELATVFLNSYEKMRNRNIKKRYDYFNRQKVIVLKKIAKLENVKKAYLARNKISAAALERSKDFNLLSQLENKVTLAVHKQHALKIQIEEYSQQLSRLEPEVRLQYEVTAVDDTALVEKRNSLATLRQRYTDHNPKVKKLISEINALAKKIASEKKKKRPAQKITYGKNWNVSRLEDKIFSAQTELKSLEFDLEKYAIDKPILQAKLARLNKTASEYREIKRKIALDYDMLKEIDAGVTEMSLALTSTVSDLRIFEKAEPPVYPSIDKRRKKLVIGVVLGIILAAICAVVMEVVDLTVKSKFDVENVLNVNALGSLPKINEVRLKKFYSATQLIFTKIFKANIDSKQKNILIAFGDVDGGTGKTFFIKKCIDVFGPMEKKVLYISSCNELASGLLKYKINDFIYNDQEIDMKLAKENNDHLYFLLDNYSYIVPIDTVQIERFIEKFTGYDFIFWELFDFKKNEPLFTTICLVAQTTVIMTKFKKSKKIALLKCIKHLKEHNVKNIGAIVNSVEKNYFATGV